MSPHQSDQMSKRSQVPRIAPLGCSLIEVPYLIFVLFGTPPYFLASKKYAKKVRKFATKIASRQNSVNFWLAYLVFWFSYLIFCWRTWFFLGVISVLFIILSLLVCLFGILVGILGVLLGVLGVLHGVLGQFKFFSSDVQIYEETLLKAASFYRVLCGKRYAGWKKVLHRRRRRRRLISGMSLGNLKFYHFLSVLPCHHLGLLYISQNFIQYMALQSS